MRKTLLTALAGLVAATTVAAAPASADVMGDNYLAVCAGLGFGATRHTMADLMTDSGYTYRQGQTIVAAAIATVCPQYGGPAPTPTAVPNPNSKMAWAG